MAENNNRAQQGQRAEEIKESTFAEPIAPKSTPMANVMQKPLKLATGSLFKVVSGSNETVKDDKNNPVVRAVYKVQSLNSKLLPLTTEFEIKVKGQKCLLSEQDNMNIMFNAKMVIVAFDGLAYWNFNGKEGLNATGVRTLHLSQDQIMNIVGASHE